MSLTYLDFDVEIAPSDGQLYTVAVRSRAGEVHQTVTFPFTDAELETHLLKVENALLRSASVQRSNLTPAETAVQLFGQQLFDFLLTGELLSQYRECLREANYQGKGVRLRLQVQSPLLATLPWEFLYDPRKRDYVCLDPNTPLVRYTELALTTPPLAVAPPLRILGVVVEPAILPQSKPLNVEDEKQRVITAVRALEQQKLVELTWLDGQTALALQRALRRGPWHILHFIGHGGFDPQRNEGLLWLVDEQGQPEPLYATQLARLLASQHANLRLVLLNSCEGARGSAQDLLASTAATLVNSGIPAVLAMQYAITDGAAVQFARTFYEALADNLPVDAAVADARNAINLRDRLSLEWGTPVLYMHAPDGVLFAVTEKNGTRRRLSGQETKTQPTQACPAAEPKEQTAGEAPGQAAEGGAVAPAVAKVPAEVRSVATPAVLVVSTPPLHFDWCSIPAGEFLLGSDRQKDAHAYPDEQPQHKLFLPDYRIARVPVTNEQYKQFMDVTGHEAPEHWPNGQIPNNKANHPAVNLNWHDALAFCAWAQVRLPSEAEWEKAARGTDGRIYPWGDAAPDGQLCNFDMQAGSTTPVDRYPQGASCYGCLDMAGNVWEWTQSLWGDDWGAPDFMYPYVPNDGRENLSAAESVFRVLRGGAYNLSGNYMRCAARYWLTPDLKYNNVGFRVVMDSKAVLY